MEVQRALSELKEWIHEDALVVIDGVTYTGENYQNHDKEIGLAITYHGSARRGYYVDYIFYFDANEMYALDMSENENCCDVCRCRDNVLASYIYEIPGVNSKLVNGDAETMRKVKCMIKYSTTIMNVQFGNVMKSIINS